MGKTMDDLIQMGKGALSYGEDALKKIEESDTFKSIDRDVKDFADKFESESMKLKDNLMAKGKEYDEKKNVNNNVNNENNK